MSTSFGIGGTSAVDNFVIKNGVITTTHFEDFVHVKLIICQRPSVKKLALH